jgi:hypothetical protein
MVTRLLQKALCNTQNETSLCKLQESIGDHLSYTEVSQNTDMMPNIF